MMTSHYVSKYGLAFATTVLIGIVVIPRGDDVATMLSLLGILGSGIALIVSILRGRE